MFQFSKIKTWQNGKPVPMILIRGLDDCMPFPLIFKRREVFNSEENSIAIYKLRDNSGVGTNIRLEPLIKALVNNRSKVKGITKLRKILATPDRDTEYPIPYIKITDRCMMFSIEMFAILYEVFQEAWSRNCRILAKLYNCKPEDINVKVKPNGLYETAFISSKAVIDAYNQILKLNTGQTEIKLQEAFWIFATLNAANNILVSYNKWATTPDATGRTPSHGDGVILNANNINLNGLDMLGRNWHTWKPSTINQALNFSLAAPRVGLTNHMALFTNNPKLVKLAAARIIR